jgi:hypothetical protein
VEETIRVIFGGEIALFLAQDTAILGDVRQQLDEQVGRLSPLEHMVLTWLAVEREPVAARADAVEAVEAVEAL